MQRQAPTKGINAALVRHGPVGSKCSVAGTRDAGDMGKTGRVQIGGGCKGPWAPFRPAGYSEVLCTQGIGQGQEVACP